MLRIGYQEMRKRFEEILVAEGFEQSRASQCAEIFADNSLFGVTSHGVNRLPRFISLVRKGKIIIDASPTYKGGFGAIEQWEGNHAPGPINAMHCTERAMAIAEKQGLGCIALSNTTHWMRGGTYGWKTAEAGYAFIGWTNTKQNLPPWGAKDHKLGNNPLIVGIPRKPDPVVLDMAMSQYSYGKLEAARDNGTQLPQPGGYDARGQLSHDPSSILDSGRLLPIGFWKGAGLSFVLDMLAALLSDGNAAYQVGQGDEEINLSQIFIALRMDQLVGGENQEAHIAAIIDDLHRAASLDNSPVLFPGERAAQTREDNLKHGIPVNPSVWETIQSL